MCIDVHIPRQVKRLYLRSRTILYAQAFALSALSDGCVLVCSVCFLAGATPDGVKKIVNTLSKLKLAYPKELSHDANAQTSGLPRCRT